MSDETRNEPRAPLRVLLAYAAPAVSSSFVFTAVSLYLLKYSTDVLLIAPATVGLIFAVGRFWDAFTDPVVGALSDRTRSRLGRRRPWLLASALPVAAAYLAIWSPPEALAGTSLALWMGAAILLFYTAITAFSVPFHALGAELSAGYHDRTRVFGAKAFGDHVGLLASVGFRPNVAQSAEALLGIRTAISLLPVVCHALALLLLARLSMDEAAHARIRHRIETHHIVRPALGGEGIS